MESNLDRAFKNSPVSQDAQPSGDVEVWEPPFERWIRLADLLLRETPGLARKTPRPQTLTSIYKH